jgi:hypothetical protein
VKRKLEIWLSADRAGRIALHLAAALAGGHWAWHFSGIARELI